MQTEIDEITKKLEPYNVTISILGFFIKKVNAVNITASILWESVSTLWGLYLDNVW